MRNDKLVLDRLFSKSFMEDRGKTQSAGEGGRMPGHGYPFSILFYTQSQVGFHLFYRPLVAKWKLFLKSYDLILRTSFDVRSICV